MVLDVTRTVLQKYGHKITADVQKSAIGRKPLDAWQATIDQLNMENVTAQQLFDESESYLKSRYLNRLTHAVQGSFKQPIAVPAHVDATVATTVPVCCRWQDARLMPGAARLLWHLHSHGIPLALATSTPRATFERKMSGKAAQALTAVFQAGDCHHGQIIPAELKEHSVQWPVCKHRLALPKQLSTKGLRCKRRA